MFRFLYSMLPGKEEGEQNGKGRNSRTHVIAENFTRTRNYLGKRHRQSSQNAPAFPRNPVASYDEKSKFIAATKHREAHAAYARYRDTHKARRRNLDCVLPLLYSGHSPTNELLHGGYCAYTALHNIVVHDKHKADASSFRCSPFLSCFSFKSIISRGDININYYLIVISLSGLLKRRLSANTPFIIPRSVREAS